MVLSSSLSVPVLVRLTFPYLESTGVVGMPGTSVVVPGLFGSQVQLGLSLGMSPAVLDSTPSRSTDLGSKVAVSVTWTLVSPLPLWRASAALRRPSSVSWMVAQLCLVPSAVMRV